jgi:hypothetical protein
MYAVESGGAWGPGVTLAPPGNAVAGFRSLTSVSCTAVGYCVAVGEYKSSDAPFRGLTITESAGVWAPAKQIKPEPGELISGPGDGLGSVSCTSAGNCVAGGIYLDAAGGEPMVVSETDGIWGTPTALDQPAGSGGTNTVNGVKVACTSQGNCVAAAQYLASVVPNDNRPMVVTETGGSWGSAMPLQLPANANTIITTQNARVHGASCPSAGECVVTGDYVSGAETHPWAATETGGSWHPATEVGLPADATPATTAPSGYFAADSLTSVSCLSAGNCVAAGYYTYASGTCGNCQKPIAVNEANGVWGAPVVLSLPPDVITPNSNGNLAAISCTAPGFCTVGGGYGDANGGDAMVATSVPALTISNTRLPAGVTGSPYNAQLTAAGGTGSYTWSLGSGSLPTGLKLNATTGEITGTPSAAGTYRFTVAVHNAGPPSQQTPAALSITIASGQSTTASVGNQTITLSAPPASTCLAKSSGLLVKLASERTKGSPKLTFSSARLYIDRGRKITKTKSVPGTNGRKHSVPVTTYAANATVGHLPATLRLSLSGQRGGSHTLSAMLSFARKVRRNGHQLTLTVTKTLRASFTVC